MNLFFNLLSCKFQVICLDGNASRKRFLSKCPQNYSYFLRISKKAAHIFDNFH